MNTKMLLIMGACVTAMLTGCESLDKGALAGAGLAAANSGKGGKKSAAIAAGAAGATMAAGVGATNSSRQQGVASANPRDNVQQISPSYSVSNNASTSSVSSQTTPTERKPQPPPEQPKPEYTVEQYRMAFEKRTPEQIVNDIIAVHKMTSSERKIRRYNPITMIKALTWKNKGMEVYEALRQKDNVVFKEYNGKIFSAICSSLESLPDSKTQKEAIKKVLAENDFGCYGVFERQIKDPDVADYMFSLNKCMGYKVTRDLVSKLSDGKKMELYNAAMKRAAERKDRIVIEGFYVGMPVLDAFAICTHLGWTATLLGEDLDNYRVSMFFGKDEDEGHTKPASEAKVCSLQFSTKGWSQFMDCEDKDGLYQCLHQYVKGRKGRPTANENLEYLQMVKLDYTADKVQQVYQNTRLGSKLLFYQKRCSLALTGIDDN